VYAVVFTRGYVILHVCTWVTAAATEFLRYVTLPLGRFSVSSVRELPTYGASYYTRLMNEFSMFPLSFLHISLFFLFLSVFTPAEHVERLTIPAVHLS